MYAASVTGQLPIDPLLPDACASLTAGNLVLVAPPGAGKTTRLPPALLARAVAGDRTIVVVEPRRLAARLAAERVAAELGQAVGEQVGYQVRFDSKVSAATRILFVTEGLLARRMMADPKIGDVGVVLIDEFHERNLAGDLTLALCRRVQARQRPDLRIAVMSATLDPEPVAAYLDNCPILVAEGRSHPVTINYLDQPMRDPLEREVARAVSRVVRQNAAGDVLVFLPGVAEIRRSIDACAELAERFDLACLPLHGQLASAEQKRAVTPGRRRKVIFATNVAETSITIEGVAAVIDSGLARIARHAPWSGMSSLRIEPVSRASCDQRAGRAGRTGPGHCLRLYTRHDYETRRPFEIAEIHRSDLSDAALLLAAAGFDIADDIWFERPPLAATAAAQALLMRLGAVDGDGSITQLGRQMAELAVHPRLARVALEAARRGVLRDGCLMVALLSELGSWRRGSGPAEHTSSSDVLDQLDAHGDRVPKTVAKLAGRLERGLAKQRASSPSDVDETLRLALLAGFIDRVARRRSPGSREVLLCDAAGGGQAELHPASAVRDHDLLVAIDADKRSRGHSSQVSIRVASAIDPLWLLELGEADVRDDDQLVFDDQQRRVVRVRRTLFDGLVLEESRTGDPAQIDRERAGGLVADAARRLGIDRLIDADELVRLRARVDFVRQHAPEHDLPAMDDAALDRALDQAASGCLSLAELSQASLIDVIVSELGPRARTIVDRLAPEYVSIPGRRRVPVQYTDDGPPHIASRMQDFFGARQGPRIADGRVPLVLHLLAPNRRAVQVTDDLERFWRVHYPEQRRQLSRRYPRHAWPEDPLR